MNQKILNIIVTHYKTHEILRMCLDSIKKNIEDIDYDVSVADSNTDFKKISEMEKEYPEVRFIKNKDNLGFSKIVNPVIKETNGDYIFIINADILFKKRSSNISEMMDYLKKNEDVGVLSPRLTNKDASFQQNYFRNYTFMTVLARRTLFGKTNIGKKAINRFKYEDKKNVKEPLEVDWLMGSAFLMKRSRLNKVGTYFDDRFFMYFEDVDLCRRFKKNGFRVVYYPMAEFIHHHMRGSYNGLGFFDVFKSELTRVHIYSYLKYVWKWYNKS